MHQKGVNVNSDLIDNECSKKNSCNENRRLRQVKEDVKYVIDTMGPDTPKSFNTTTVCENSECPSRYVDNQENSERIDMDGSVTDYSTSKDVTESLRYDQERSFAPENFEDSSQQDSRITIQCDDPCICPVFKSCNIQQNPCSQDHKCADEQVKSDMMRKLYQWLLEKNMFRKDKYPQKIPIELYKMSVLKEDKEVGLPSKLVFDLVDGVPKPITNTIGVNTTVCECDAPNEQYNYSYNQPVEKKHKPQMRHNVSFVDKKGGKIDIYYFDHGNSAYFKTTDCPPILITELLAEKTEEYTTKFWAQIFGTAHIGFAFFTTFIVQLLRFILQSLIRPLTVGIAQIISDYFLKPCLTVLFNAIIQPLLILLYNIATSLRDLLDPVAEGIGYFLREIAVLLRAIRLVEVRKTCACEHYPNCDDQICPRAKHKKKRENN